jgi:hypothetical protein
MSNPNSALKCAVLSLIAQNEISRLTLGASTLWLGFAACRVVQDDSQEGIVDLKRAIVTNEAQFPEFIHEKIDPRARRADHFRQHLLRYFWEQSLRVFLLAVSRKQ